MTVETLERRKDELFQGAATFAQRVLAVVREARAQSHDEEGETELDGNARLQGIDFNDDFPERGPETQPEDDVEDRELPDDADVRASIDEGARGGDEEVQGEESYIEVVWTFMEVMLTNSLSTFKLNEMLKCPLCQVDPTMSEEQKKKERSPKHLRDHMSAQLHCGYQEFRRRSEIVTQQKRELHPKARYACPCCTQIFPPNCGEQPLSFLDTSTLAKHVEKSNSEEIHGFGAWKLDDDMIRLHDELKRDAGWYDAGFKDNEQRRIRSGPKRERSSASDGSSAGDSSSARSGGISLSEEPELGQGVADEWGFVQGGPGVSTDDMLATYPSFLTDVNPKLTTDAILAMFPGILTDVDPKITTADILKRSPGVLTDQPPKSGTKRHRTE